MNVEAECRSIWSSWLPELLSEDRPTFLSRDCIERVFMERLSTFYAGYDPPFSYLVACYRQALEEVRKAQIMKD